MWMNHWDIDEQVARHRHTPVLDRATRFLADLRDETNAHSDGWCYWHAPSRAANQLMVLIQSGSATEAQYAKALTPIRSFFTRRGNAAGMVFPQV